MDSYLKDYLSAPKGKKSINSYKRKLLGDMPELTPVYKESQSTTQWTGYSESSDEEVHRRHDTESENEDKDAHEDPQLEMIRNSVTIDEEGDLILPRPNREMPTPSNWLGAKPGDYQTPSLPALDMGKNAATIYRDNTGKIVSKQDFRSKEEEIKHMNEERLKKWSGGVIQKEVREARIKEFEEEKNRPFARYEIETEVDNEIKKRQRFDDPFKKFEELEGRKKRKVDKAKLVCQFSWSNRFGIRPGYRWDGVDRTNGFEMKWMNLHKIS